MVGCERQICFVSDRPGHDFRYGLDATKLRRALGWVPRETFEVVFGKQSSGILSIVLGGSQFVHTCILASGSV
jgi:hypothetical protein